MGFVPIITYASVAVFLLAVIVRFVKISTMPIHLRWELYPVAHEKGRAQYGGSYLEESDWWTKKRHSSMLGELMVMVPEILFLHGVWEHNKRHWFRTFPFHFGLYLLGGFLALLLIGGIAVAAGGAIDPDAGFLGALVYHLTSVFGYAGMVLALIGSLSLLGRRIFDEDYREYTKGADYFNLVFFIAALGVAFTNHLTADTGFMALRAYFAGLVTFDFAFQGTGLMALEIILASVLIAYIPLTHMSHFFTKYFTYHSIRWSDAPNLKGGEMEGKIGKVLSYPVSWSAPHIRGDGKKNWVDVATSDVEEKSE